MRDPLTDPQPGDRVRFLGRIRRVAIRTPQTVVYAIEGEEDYGERVLLVKDWRSLCRRNEAVEVKE